MANSSAMQTYQAVGDREDLIDVITNISPEETPMFSSFGKTKAKGTYHEWLEDSLSSATSNSNIEGADYSFSRRDPRTREGAYTQIFVTPVEVSDTKRVVDAAGIEDEYSYQMAKALKEHARDIEYAICSTAAGGSGASATARTLKGVLAWITSVNETGTATSDEDLTESMFNDALQDIWDNGGSPDTVYANGYQKRQIGTFTDSATKFVEATSEKEMLAGVNVYDSDFGRVKIKKSRYMPANTVAILQSDLWKVAVLRPTESEEVAKVGDSTRGVVKTELTLEARNEAGSGKITQLNTS
jgi:hypothetical protein